MATKSSEIATEPGNTSIEEQVVAKIAGAAIREIPGVWALGSTTSRAFEVVRSAVSRNENAGQGISAEVGQTQAAIDLQLIVEYPHPIQEVAGKVRAAIIKSVQDVAGLEVTEVNIDVTDVHFEGEEPPAKEVAKK